MTISQERFYWGTDMRSISLAIGLALLAAFPAAAQQRVEFRNGIPIAPSGIAIPPLPDKPVVYHTAEGQDIRVVVYARGLKRPWSQAFLPDGVMLVTERGGQVRAIRNGVLDPQLGRRAAERARERPRRPHGHRVHPKFADNHYVYLSIRDLRTRTPRLSRSRAAVGTARLSST